MPVEKAFDPTVSRINTSEPRDSQVPDDIDIDDVYESSDGHDPFVDSLDTMNADAYSTSTAAGDGPMPPPLVGETEPSADPQLADSAASLASLEEQKEAMVARVREKLSTADTRVRAFVERRPIVALCGAAAAGFFIGRIVSRI